jgi:hypothetical protein
MGYEVKQRGDKFVVVDTDTKRIRGTYDSEDDAEDRKDDLDFKVEVRDRLSRVPVTEMTADEKAAEYDRLMAAKANAPDPHVPPAREGDDNGGKKDPPKTTVRRSAYWGELPGED